MKIQVHRPVALKNQPITIREKTIYTCKSCRNRYYSYHYFCPQCLGEVNSSSSNVFLLQILACPAEHLQEAASLLQKLSGNGQMEFESALSSLPWICMLQSDPVILQKWKECLESESLSVEILSTMPVIKKKRKKPVPPLFASNAPAPLLLPSSLIQNIRASNDSIPSASAKLKWAETVALSFKLLERLYKNASERLLFYDFIFQIEEQIREFALRVDATRWNESAFEKRIDKLQELFGRMESEMEAVRDQVRDQL
jgi:hypothetical protein